MRLIFANRLEKRRKYGYFILQWFGPGGGMADAADLKSVGLSLTGSSPVPGTIFSLKMQDFVPFCAVLAFQSSKSVLF